MDVHAEKPLFGACISKSQRQTSDASTALPSPEISCMVSPIIYDSEIDEAQQFMLEGLQDDTCEVANPAPPSFYSGKERMNPGVPGGGPRACVPLCLLVGALCQYHYGASIVSLLSMIMGAGAVCITFPGAYLYIIQGCRPEDCEEMHWARGNLMHKNGRGAEACVLLAFTLGALYQYHYGISVVIIFRVIMGLTAASMILPGAYLYIIQGCRPEDCEQCETKGFEEVSEESANDIDKKGRGAKACVILAFTLGAIFQYHRGMSVMSVFRAIMGLTAASMILPGAYLYIIQGCRPEDCEE
jgi:hypothetical protein